MSEGKEVIPANREKLVARWDTTDGQQLAEKVSQALDPVRTGQRSMSPKHIKPLDVDLLTQIALLPFADEVAPSIDLRGLHVTTSDPTIGIKYIDLSLIRLDYAYEIDRIIKCQTNGAILDGSHSMNGMFINSTLTGISFIGSSLNGGFFDHSDLNASNLQGAHLIKADLSYTRCNTTIFTGADLRFADLRFADLSGADLREANLTEADLNPVIFDQHTRLQGANLDGADLSPDFRTFAESAGALLSPEKTWNRKMMVEMEATVRALQQMNTNGRYNDAIVAVSRARELFRDNPDYSYSDGFDEVFACFGSPPTWKDEVLEVWDESSKSLAYYL